MTSARNSRRARIQKGGGQGVRTPPPPPKKKKKSQNYKVSNSNTGPDSLKNHKVTKPAFNVGPSSARHRNAISSSTRQRNAIKIAFRWLADDGPLIVECGSSLPSSTKKSFLSWTPSDKTFTIHVCSGNTVLCP